jgi:hypothetical protein
MVKKILAFFAYTLFFVVALMYFTPKSSVYFLLEKELKKYDVVISSEEINERAFTLAVTDADVSFKSISSAKIAKSDMKIFALYNSLNFEDIILSSTAKSFVPLRVERVKVVYSILNPMNVILYGVGEFGEVNAEFNILQRSLHLRLKPSQMMSKNYKNSLKNLVKTENGEFTYDKTF